MIFRRASIHDKPFVMASWLRSARLAGDHALMDDETFYPWLREKIDRFVVDVVVGVSDTNPDQIIGFAAGNRKLKRLDFVYVKEAFRRLGYANALVKEFGAESTTGVPKSEWLRHKMKLRFLPWN